MKVSEKWREIKFKNRQIQYCHNVWLIQKIKKAAETGARSVGPMNSRSVWTEARAHLCWV
jgi:hypothetical protein